MRDSLGRIQHVAVFGGTSEIAHAIVEATQPALVTAVGRDADAMEAAYAAYQTRVVRMDADDLETHQTAVDEVFEAGDIDVVVVAFGRLERDTSVESSIRMAGVNYAGSISVLLRSAERIRQQGHGTLVVLSSIAIVRPRPSNWRYGATKAGLDFAARGLEAELAGSGATVLVVRPGFVRTRMSRGLPEPPLTVNPDVVGTEVAAAIATGSSGVLWVPRSLAVLSVILRLLPQRLLAKIDSPR